MTSICSYGGIVPPQWRTSSPNRKKFNLWVLLLHPKKKISFLPSLTPITISSSFSDDAVPPAKQTKKGYDPSKELFGLSTQSQPSLKDASIVGALKPRSWFGPNGQYIRELPCPSCRGRGYTLCTECGIERSQKDCSQCNGKGVNTCHQCLGDCVIWEESIDERPWEKARSISPFKVKEDDEVDNLELHLNIKRKSKRVYQSPPPEVGLKISRSLKSLNARTGLFSKRMKIIHGDPTLHAQRVAAIKVRDIKITSLVSLNNLEGNRLIVAVEKLKQNTFVKCIQKAKRTDDARKHASESMKHFFSDPENRRKRSISMKGVKFYCKCCGREGHRKHYCPDLEDDKSDRRFKCRLCGERGHNRRTCPMSKTNESRNIIPRNHHCRICGQSGHNRRTCRHNGLEKIIISPVTDSMTFKKRTYTCRLCMKKGHNIRTCPTQNGPPDQ